MRGICFDGNGNIAEFVTSVGYSPSRGVIDDYTAGVGLLGASSSLFAMIVSADSVEELCGEGSYMGGSANIPVVPSPSLGYDAVFLGKRLKDITTDTVPDGGQVSLGGSIGITWMHEGDSYTYIRYIVKNGVVVPKEESIWISGKKE